MYTFKKVLFLSVGLLPLKFCSSAESRLERFAIDIAGPKILFEMILFKT